MATPARPRLSLGPLHFHWSPEKRRDFYFRIADEACVEDVYLGEAVCAKREPSFEPFFAEVAERLERGGKRVFLSSLALLTTPRELAALKDKANGRFVIEADDVAAIEALDGRPFIIGPMITVLNEGALGFLVRQGAERIVFAAEMTGAAMTRLAGLVPVIETEAQIFGHQPLAISMRCFSARAAGRDKDHCRFACATEGNGLPVQTLDEEPILTVSGTQTLSSGVVALAGEALALASAGLTALRLAPMDADMPAIAAVYADLLEGRIGPDSALNALKALVKDVAFINGFYHGREGRVFVTSGQQAASS